MLAIHKVSCYPSISTRTHVPAPRSAPVNQALSHLESAITLAAVALTAALLCMGAVAVAVWRKVAR